MTNEMHDAAITTPEGIGLSLFEVTLLALATNAIAHQRDMAHIMDGTVRAGSEEFEAVDDNITPEWENLRDKMILILDELSLGEGE